jgi:uncharacterized delta-60 repeat protein
MARRLSAYSILFLLSVASPVLAAPGDLDPSFGTGGVALGPTGSQFFDVVRQPDGKLVAAGYRTLTPKHLLVARFETDGTLDATFGTGGMVETAVGTGQIAVADEVVLQPDGKIVVAGYALQGDVVLVLARYETDGSLDATFGSGGIVTLAGPGDQYAFALVLQSDGKLVAAGAGFEPTAADWRSVLVRFDTDGTLDATFGTGGVVTRSGSQIDAILQQPDGKLVAAGYYQPGVAFFPHFAVFRYEADGSPDPSFGTGGMVSTSISVQRDHASAIVRQADGGFVVGGWRWDDSTNSDLSPVLVRYDAAGVLDATFGTDGIAQVPDARYDTQVGLAEQPNGKLVMAAHLVVDNLTKIAVIRWQPDGTLDPTFGDGGVQTTRVSSPSGSADLARGVLFEPDGRIVAVGTAAARAAVVAYESGFCCTGGPCVECGVCETCGLAGCEAAPVDDRCPDDGNTCTTEGCDGAGTCLHPAGPAGVACTDEGNICTSDVCDAAGACLHPFEPAPVCDQPSAAGKASLKMRSSADAGKDRVQFKWAKGNPTSPVDPQTLRLCVYDRSGGGYTAAYQGSPNDPNGVWKSSGTTNVSIKYISKTAVPDGIKKVTIKLKESPTKSNAQVQAAGNLALAPFPLQKDPSVIAQIRWASGQCWGATFSTAVKSDAERFIAKSD